MLQKVGLAQALVNDPELLILDEPTSALDPAARVQVREMLLAARRAGNTIFLSSHLLSEIEMVCDRIAILHRGRLVRMGTVAELLESQSESVIMARNLGRDELGGELVAQGMWRFRVPAERQRATIERIWAAGGEIVSIAGVRKSLEELFLELTGAEKSEESNSR